MTSDELKKDCRTEFPSLKKPFFGRDVIECRDGEYNPILPHSVYAMCYRVAWAEVEDAGIIYDENFPDCDDFADMMLGLFKLEWWKAAEKKLIPRKTPPVFGVIDGYNPQGENHNYCYFRSSEGHFIGDYNSIIPTIGYKPMRMRF